MRKLGQAERRTPDDTVHCGASHGDGGGGDAGVATKAEAVKELEDMACEIKSYELSEIKVLFLNNDAAFMTYKAAQDGTCGGQPVPAAVWASSAYVKRGGKWFAASHQETPAKP